MRTGMALSLSALCIQNWVRPKYRGQGLTGWLCMHSKGWLHTCVIGHLKMTLGCTNVHEHFLREIKQKQWCLHTKRRDKASGLWAFYAYLNWAWTLNKFKLVPSSFHETFFLLPFWFHFQFDDQADASLYIFARAHLFTIVQCLMPKPCTCIYTLFRFIFWGWSCFASGGPDEQFGTKEKLTWGWWWCMICWIRSQTNLLNMCIYCL